MVGLTQRERAYELKDQIVEGWLGGRSISELSRSFSLSRGIVSKVIEDSGTRGAQPPSGLRPSARNGGGKRVAALEWTRNHPGSTIDDLAEAMGVMHRTAADYVAGTPEQKLIIETRRKPREYTDEEMEDHIRAVWDSLPAEEQAASGGLSKKRFMALAAEGAPSGALYDRRYASWVEACEAAGVPSGKTYRSSYSKTYSDDDILDAVNEYILDTGMTSFHGYAAWALGRDEVPSGGLVVLRYGTWSATRRALLDRQRVA